MEEEEEEEEEESRETDVYSVSWTWLVSSTLTPYIHLPRNDNIRLNQVKLQNWFWKITSSHHRLEHNSVYKS